MGLIADYFIGATPLKVGSCGCGGLLFAGEGRGNNDLCGESREAGGGAMKARKVWIGDMCVKGCIDKQPHRNCSGMCTAGRWLPEAEYRKLMAVVRAVKKHKDTEYWDVIEALDKLEGRAT